MYEGMLAESLTIRGHNGDPIAAYIARPLGAGPFPGVVVIHHMPGWDEWTREVVRKFAQHGYAAISPHLYSRIGEGSPDDVAAKARAQGGVADDQVVGDVAASAAFAASVYQFDVLVASSFVAIVADRSAWYLVDLLKS